MSEEAYIEGITAQRDKAWQFIASILHNPMTHEEIIAACKQFFAEDNAD